MEADPSSFEARRLAALRSYEILDTAPEAAFDRITKLAQDLFGLPVALISLVDDKRQWFKSRVGLNVAETPRSWAFCNHAIAQSAPLVVPDASIDERFRDNPLVTGDLGVRFYAGAQIRDDAGLALGTVCVLSDQPNVRFSAADEARLNSLAEIVANKMELRRQIVQASRRAIESESMLREVHHQVANSLQIVADVLGLQAEKIPNKDAATHIGNAAGRVMALGDLHRQLRQQGTAATASANPYLTRLARRLWAGVHPEDSRDRLTISVPEDLVLPSEMLIRIGLAATALTINAIRHGAIGLGLGLSRSGPSHILAIGFDGGSEGYDTNAPDTGFRMLKMLTGDSDVVVDPDNPRRYLVTFRA